MDEKIKSEDNGEGVLPFTLPSVVLQNLFLFLNHNDLRTARLVCHQWNSEAGAFVMKRSVVRLDRERVFSFPVQNVTFADFEAVRGFFIHNNGEGQTQEIRLPPWSSELEGLVIPPDLCLPSVKTVRVNNGLSSAFAAALFRALPNVENLTVVDRLFLSEDLELPETLRGITWQDGSVLVTDLRLLVGKVKTNQLTSICFLNDSRLVLNFQMGFVLEELLSKQTNLLKFILKCTPIEVLEDDDDGNGNDDDEDAMLPYLTLSLPELPHLKTLIITDIFHFRFPCPLIYLLLELLPSLERLELENVIYASDVHPLRPDGLLEWVLSTENNRVQHGLKELEIRGEIIEEDSCNIFKQLKSLQRLTVWVHGDDALRRLFSRVRENVTSTLTHLTVKARVISNFQWISSVMNICVCDMKVLTTLHLTIDQETPFFIDMGTVACLCQYVKWIDLDNFQSSRKEDILAEMKKAVQVRVLNATWLSDKEDFTVS